MNTTLKTFLLIVGGFALSVVGGNVWWALWMNHGWPGSPGILPDLLRADGEGAYNAMMTEMMLIIGLALCGIWILFMLRRAKA